MKLNIKGSSLTKTDLIKYSEEWVAEYNKNQTPIALMHAGARKLSLFGALEAHEIFPKIAEAHSFIKIMACDPVILKLAREAEENVQEDFKEKIGPILDKGTDLSVITTAVKLLPLEQGAIMLMVSITQALSKLFEDIVVIRKYIQKREQQKKTDKGIH